MWRFVQVSDPHLASQRDGEWNNRFLCTMMPDVMECLRGDLQKLAPDFILATGDIASQQTQEAMFEARDMMDSLGIPYFPMGGNHDFVVEESRDWFLDAFEHRLPVQKTYYSFDHKNLHFCVLDPWWKWSDDTLSLVCEPKVKSELDTSLKGARWSVPPDQLAWLEEDLRAHRDKPVIIAVHYPAVPIPKRLHRPNFKDGGCLDNGDMLLELAREHPQVKVFFSGHVHMHFIEPVDGVVQVTTGSLPEYPVEYRDIRVYDDRLEISTLELSDKSFAERSLINGKNWTRGEERDRTATIPLI